VLESEYSADYKLRTRLTCYDNNPYSERTSNISNQYIRGSLWSDIR